jgi:hypothetical protein
MPRVAAPRLGLSTKGRAAVNPFKGNTMKVASLRTGYHELLLEKRANGTLTLRQFRELQELEKEAGLADSIRLGVSGIANAAKTRAPKFLQNTLGNIAERSARSAQPGLTREVADAAEGLRRARDTMVVPTHVRDDLVQRATQRQTAAVERLNRAGNLSEINTPLPRAATPPPAAAATPPPAAAATPPPAAAATPPPAAAATPPPAAAATPPPAETSTSRTQRRIVRGQRRTPAAQQQPQAVVQQPQAVVQQPPTEGATVPAPSGGPGIAATSSSAEELLNRLMKAAPVGVAGGLTAYGGLRGWNEGQAEVNRSLQQGFNPSTRY